MSGALLALTVIAGVVAILAVLCSLQRLAFLAGTPRLHPDVVREALVARGSRFLSELRQAARSSGAVWELELAEAFLGDPSARVARVNEVLLEVDFALERWGRVPRVAASVASSAGFLLAAVTLRVGLTQVGSLETNGVDDAVLAAVNVASFGIAGAIICATIHVRAKRYQKDRQAAVDGLIARLETLPRDLQAIPDGPAVCASASR